IDTAPPEIYTGPVGGCVCGLYETAGERLADAPGRAAMGEAARLRVIEQFTLRQTIDTFRSIYLELPALARSAAAPPRIAMAPVPAQTSTAPAPVPAAAPEPAAAQTPVAQPAAPAPSRPRRPVPSWARTDTPATEESATSAVSGTGSLAG
ncbi:hypothetical protein ACFXC2_13190, partial [Streptomyces lavendulae]